MKRFEYKIEKYAYYTDIQEKYINELGMQGWELISVVSPEINNGNGYTFYYFKREITNGSII